MRPGILKLNIRLGNLGLYLRAGKIELYIRLGCIVLYLRSEKSELYFKDMESRVLYNILDLRPPLQSQNALGSTESQRVYRALFKDNRAPENRVKVSSE